MSLAFGVGGCTATMPPPHAGDRGPVGAQLTAGCNALPLEWSDFGMCVFALLSFDRHREPTQVLAFCEQCAKEDECELVYEKADEYMGHLSAAMAKAAVADGGSGSIG